MVAIGLIGFKPGSFHVVGIKRCGLKVFADPFAYVKRVDLICPGFPADCLETLQEINDENREYFQAAGGETFHYIPALNDRGDRDADSFRYTGSRAKESGVDNRNQHDAESGQKSGLRRRCMNQPHSLEYIGEKDATAGQQPGPELLGGVVERAR